MSNFAKFLYKYRVMNKKVCFYCFSLVWLITFVGCDSFVSNKTNVSNPLTASGVSKDELPVIVFEKESYDFGKIIQGEKVSYRFKFKNEGKTDLVISAVTTSCGCTTPEYSKEPIEPGKDGYVTVKFDSENRQGVQQKSITVLANTLPNSTVLHIKAEVVSPER